MPIVPITLDVIKINKGGNLVKGKLTTRGRTYSLQKIMDRLLHIHEKARYLCDPSHCWHKKELEAKGEHKTRRYNFYCVIDNIDREI